MNKQVWVVTFTMLLLSGMLFSAGIVDQAGIYLPFEGPDNGLGSTAWFNHGTMGNFESSSRLGVTGSAPTVTASGLKGQAYDATGLIPEQGADSSYMWGEFSSDTAMEQAFIDIDAFTISCWVKVDPDADYTQGRILVTPVIEINYVMGNVGTPSEHAKIAVEVGGASFVNATEDLEKYGAKDQWRFIAVTYDGTTAVDNLKFYYATANEPVAQDIIASVAEETLERTGSGGNLWLGNVIYDAGDKPFVGKIDELRVWSSQGDNSAVLSLSELEEVRQYDLMDLNLVAQQADIHLNFEGEDNGTKQSPCWMNRGVTGLYEFPQRPDSFVNPTPTVTENGLRGQAYDSSQFTPETASHAYMYGLFNPTDTPIEQTLIDVNSITITAWVKVPADATYTQGRLFSSFPLEVNYLMGNHGQPDEYARFATRIESASYVNSTHNMGYYLAKDKWVFVAITYDGLAPNGQLKYYFGNEDNQVDFDLAVDANQGALERGGHGGNLWLGNITNYDTGDKPFVGYIDEFRIYSSTDSEGALSLQEIEAIRQYDLSNPGGDESGIVEFADLYLPFEGELPEEDVINAPAWRNRGITGPGESASRMGPQTSPLTRANAIALFGAIPDITVSGLKGQAYNGTAFTGLSASNTLNWGEFSFDTAIEDVIKDIWSFTITGWLKMDNYVDQGRIFGTVPVELNFIQKTTQKQIQARIAGSGYTPHRSSASNLYDAVEKWIFFAMTYDGTKTENNVRFFIGNESMDVAPDTVSSASWGQLFSTGYGGNFWLGNTGATGNRPFVGYIDELRIWSSQQSDESAVLNYDQIEAVRKYDLGITKCDGDFLNGDLNFDCVVNFDDAVLMLKNWIN